jgi:DNA-binding NarL/FixJ family response regulator
MKAVVTPDVSVAVCDSQALVRRGICTTLEREHDIAVIAEVDDGADLAQILTRCRPHVLLLENRFSHCCPIALRDTGSPATIILAEQLEAEQLIALLAIKTQGILHRSGSLSDLIRAVYVVGAGGSYLAPEFSEVMMRVFRTQLSRAGNRTYPNIEQLTLRERDVLDLVCTGKSNREVARALGLGERTVKFHVSSVLAKTGMHSRSQLIASMATFPVPISGRT